LCANGDIKGIKRSAYTAGEKNRQYATDAVTLISRNRALAEKPNDLWRLVPNAPETENGQMAVVTALWTKGMLRPE
jgi:hypothetical protein